jgi:hypothetical protein
MANLIARIAVLLVLAAAGMVLADRKEKIDLATLPFFGLLRNMLCSRLVTF